MSRIDYIPGAATFTRVVDVVILGQSREVPSTRSVSALSPEAQAALTELVAKAAEYKPSDDPLVVDGLPDPIPVEVTNGVHTILKQAVGTNRVCRAYFKRDVPGFGISQEFEVRLNATDEGSNSELLTNATVSPAVLDAWATLSSEVFG